MKGTVTELVELDATTQGRMRPAVRELERSPQDLVSAAARTAVVQFEAWLPQL